MKKSHIVKYLRYQAEMEGLPGSLQNKDLARIISHNADCIEAAIEIDWGRVHISTIFEAQDEFPLSVRNGMGENIFIQFDVELDGIVPWWICLYTYRNRFGWVELSMMEKRKTLSGVEYANTVACGAIDVPPPYESTRFLWAGWPESKGDDASLSYTVILYALSRIHEEYPLK